MLDSSRQGTTEDVLATNWKSFSSTKFSSQVLNWRSINIKLIISPLECQLLIPAYRNNASGSIQTVEITVYRGAKT
jgi:hypothetical protein